MATILSPCTKHLSYENPSGDETLQLGFPDLKVHDDDLTTHRTYMVCMLVEAFSLRHTSPGPALAI